uniref:At1g68980-like TPR repeats domain-containing protein n=1 Tax=Leersia perrieri TaxID=77586 RepID=A0A0D9XJV2_9ORYZ
MAVVEVYVQEKGQMLRVGRICSRFSSCVVFSFLLGPRHLISHESPHCLDSKCSWINYTGANKIGFLNTKLNGGNVAYLSTLTETVLVQARDPSLLALEIEKAIDQQRFDDAWSAYEKHIHMDGLPRKSVLSKLITGFAETCDVHWLNQSYNVVNHAFEEKRELLEKEPLIFLSLALAQSSLPNLAINVVRKLVKMEAYPPVAAWSAIVAHMCQTATGAFLAADMVMEIGYLFQNNRVDPRKKSNRPLLLMKPNSLTFNLILTASLLFGTTKKAEQLLELMPRIGLNPDVSLLIVMAKIYEQNGHRDEIQKLRRHVNEACGLSESEFRQFYDCLLSCHLKFGDLDSTVDMVLDMLKKGKNTKRSIEAAKAVLEAVENNKVYLPCEKAGPGNAGSSNKSVCTDSQILKYLPFFKDKSFAKLELEARELLKLLSDKLQEQVGLVNSEYGILYPTETMYAKLVKAFLEADKISALASFLVKASKEDSPVSVESSFVVQVINACISLGLLEQAHDLLDEMRFSGIRVGSAIYSSLLKAYCKEGHHEDDIAALLKDAQQAGIQLDASCYEDLIQTRAHGNNTTGALNLLKELKSLHILKAGHNEFEMLVQGCENNGADLTTKLVEEVKSGNVVNHAIHDWNNVIHFFCKKRLMHDAHKALSKMRALGHTPNAQTFHSLVTGYAAVGGKYVEVTDLWGEMKVLANSNSMKFDQELLDSLLYCFVRGGFFLRAMEVIEMMEKGKMFIDKYKYKSLWLKYHRTLYKGKAPKVQTEAQLKRREAALHFKRWIGLT